MVKCNSYPEIYDYYLKVAKQVSEQYKGGVFLKTDSHNESGIFPVSKPIIPVLSMNAKKVVCIEYDNNVLDKAKPLLDQYKNVSYSRGDIRTPFKETFDVIFDFSTIDHVPMTDVPHVLDNYYNALKDGGKLVLFVWVSDNKESSDQEWNSTNQYFFYKPDLEKYLNSKFSKVTKKYVLNLDLTGHTSPRKVYLYEIKK